MTKRLSRRELLKAGVVASAAGLAGGALGACKTPTPEIIRETVIVEQTKIVEATPVRGQINALGVELPMDALPLDQQVAKLGVAAAGAGTAGGAHGHSMESLYNKAYEPGYGGQMFTTLGKDYEIVPVGCESWTFSDDLMTWTFKLRKELQFSDGTPVTAKDWEFTLKRSLGNGYDFGWFYSDIKNANAVLQGKVDKEELGIKAIDDYTLQITTEGPAPYLPSLGVWFELAPKQAYDKSENWSLEPANYVSSGPWILTQFDRGVSYRWELNTKYKGIRAPMLTMLDAKTRPAAGLATYMAGETESYGIGSGTPPYEVALINSNPILRSESHPGPSTVTYYAGFNSLPGKFAPLDNKDVRLAMSKCFDRDTVIGEVFKGFAYPAYGILPKGFPNSNPDRMKARDPNVYDPEAAKQLLSKAGYPDGKDFPKFEMWLRGIGEQDLSVCQALQAAWKDVLGIQVELKAVDQPTFTPKVFGDKDIPLYWVGYSLDYYDPSTFLNVFRDGGRHPCEDPEFTKLNAEGNSFGDATKRMAKLQDAEEMLVDNCNFIWLEQPFAISLWPCWLKGDDSPNKDGFSFVGGLPPGCAHWFEHQYYAVHDCRAALEGKK